MKKPRDIIQQNSQLIQSSMMCSEPLADADQGKIYERGTQSSLKNVRGSFKQQAIADTTRQTSSSKQRIDSKKIESHSIICWHQI